MNIASAWRQFPHFAFRWGVAISLMAGVVIGASDGSAFAVGSSVRILDSVSASLESDGRFRVSWNDVNAGVTASDERAVRYRVERSTDGWFPAVSDSERTEKMQVEITDPSATSAVLPQGLWFRGKNGVEVFTVSAFNESDQLVATGSYNGLCPKAFFVSARGTLQNDPAKGYAEGIGGMSRSIYEAVLDNLDLNGNELRPVPLIDTYPAQGLPEGKKTNLDYRGSQEKGVNDIDTFLDSTTGCTSPIALVGYSQGAHVVGDAYVRYFDRLRARTKSLIMLADAGYQPGDPKIDYYPRDHGGTGLTVPWPVTGRGRLPGDTPDGVARAYCYPGDVVCDRENSLAQFHGPIYDCYRQRAAIDVASALSAAGIGHLSTSARQECDLAKLRNKISKRPGGFYLVWGDAEGAKTPKRLTGYALPTELAQKCLDGGNATDSSWANDTYITRTQMKSYGTARASGPLAWCTLGPSLIVGTDKSYWYVTPGNERRRIPDNSTFRNIRARNSALHVWSNWSVGEISKVHRPAASSGIDPDMPAERFRPQTGTIIRRSDGVSWLVDSKGVRHHIPTAADDVCWRQLKRKRVSEIGLSTAQANTSDEGVRLSCVIGDRIVKSSDDSSWFVDKANKRHHIQDTASYAVLARRYPVSGPWPAAEVTKIPRGPDYEKLAEAPPGTIIRRVDGVSWVLDSKSVRHHIPYIQDDVCWRLLKGVQVSVTEMSAGQAGAYAEGDKWPCIIGPRIVKASDGASHFVDKANARHRIPDAETFTVLAHRYPVVGPWEAAEVAKLPKGADQEKLYDPPANSIIRRSDGVSWVVDSSHKRHHIPFVQDDVCWRLLKGAPVFRTGLTAAQAAALEEADKWPCIIGNRVVKATNGTSWFVGTDNARHHIPDTETYTVLARKYPVVGPWDTGEVSKLPKASDREKLYDPPANSIIRRSDGVSWVVDSSHKRHHIPFVQDDVCWRLLKGSPVYRSGLTATQASALEETDKWPCIIGNRVVKATNGTSWFVGTDNVRRHIPDTETYAVLARKYPVVGPWETGEVSKLPKGDDYPRHIDVQPNSIIRRSDGVSWVVDGNRERHHIPFVQDDVCWRLLKGYPVSRTGLSAEQANTVPERDKWPCIIGDRIVKSSDGASWFVDTANSRRHIRDTETYGELTRRGIGVVGPWDASEVNKLPRGADYPRLINPDTVRNGVMCRNGDGVCWVVDGGNVRHYIPSYGDQFCHQYREGRPVKRWVDGDQANSLAESNAWGCSMDNIVVDSQHDYFMSGNDRRYISDWMTYQCYTEGRRVVGAPQADVNRLREVSAMPKCLPEQGIRRKVITAETNHAYLIDSSGVWHYITNTWNCVTSKYPVYAKGVPWNQIKEYGRFREGSNATCSM